MSGFDDLLRIIDAPKEIAELDKVTAKLLAMKEELKSFAGISLFTKSTNGAADFRTQATALTEALARLKVVETELGGLWASLATKQKARTDQEIAESQRAAEATRGRVSEIRSEENAYKNLTNQYSKALSESRKLSAEYGIHSKQAKEAAGHANELGEKIQKINKAAGESRGGVGRYTEGIKSFAKEILAAGVALFGLNTAFDFVKDSIKEFMAAEQAASRLKNILSNLNREQALGELNREAKDLSESLGTVAQKDVTETFQKLITYGKLTKNQILELTPVIADFAAKQRIDMPEATSAITKAMEGNARALKEYGINIKEGKDSTERFAIIMDQLKPRVDGAAKAFGETLAGGMKKSEIATEELKVKIGEEFAPVLSSLWKNILEGIKGLPEMFYGIGRGLDMIEEKAKVVGLTILKLASLGMNKGLDRFLIEKKQQEDALATHKKYSEALEEAESFRKIAATRTLSDQEHEINIQNQLLVADLARYKAHQLSSDELIKQNEIVKALLGQYNSSSDKRILGFGGSGKKDEGIEGGIISSKAKEFMLGMAPNKNDVGRDFNDLNELANRSGGLHTGGVSPVGSHGDLDLSEDAKEKIQSLADGKDKLHNLEKEFADDALKMSESLVRDGYEKELNAIQKKIDLNEELHKRETSGIRNSTLSIQEKAAAQILLDAKVSAQKEKLLKEERDVKAREAKFDKATAILGIIENTALGVANQFKGDPYTAIPRALIVGAIGAAELATVVAKPIPTYAIGTDNHPGGPMIVGEKGAELLIRDGQTSLTPAIPTLMYGKRGDKIIPSNELNQYLLNDMMKATAMQITDNKKELNEIKEAVQEGTAAQLRAMSKKNAIHNHIHVHAGFDNHIYEAVKR